MDRVISPTNYLYVRKSPDLIEELTHKLLLIQKN